MQLFAIQQPPGTSRGIRGKRIAKAKIMRHNLDDPVPHIKFARAFGISPGKSARST
tara:strand:- start:767 stop:934 length:168 start_codon:yes stop_codon:yes gene_type:complete